MVVLSPGNHHKQSNTAHYGKGCAVIKHGRMADPVPKQPSNNVCHQSQETNGCAVPANAAGAQALRHEIRGKRLANGAEYSLKQSIEDKQGRDERNAFRARKTEIGDEEDDE